MSLFFILSFDKNVEIVLIKMGLKLKVSKILFGVNRFIYILFLFVIFL